MQQLLDISNFLCLYPCICTEARNQRRVNSLESLPVHMGCGRTQTDTYQNTCPEFKSLINFENFNYCLTDKSSFSIDYQINIREANYNHELSNMIFLNFKTSLMKAPPLSSVIMNQCVQKSICDSPLREELRQIVGFEWLI